MTTRAWLMGRLKRASDALIDHVVPLMCTVVAGLAASLGLGAAIVASAAAVTALLLARKAIWALRTRQSTGEHLILPSRLV